MDDKECVVKHLEITQSVINRLANNSFLIKGWSMTILAAAILFIGRSGTTYSAYLVLAFIIPVFGFWVLDSYFLWKERLFRGVYNDIRILNSTSFGMNLRNQIKKNGNKWQDSAFVTVQPPM